LVPQFYPAAPSLAFRLPATVFYSTMKVLIRDARKHNLIPPDSKLIVNESSGNNSTLETKRSQGKKKPGHASKVHPFSTATKSMYREYFTDDYIQSHSFHGISTNKSTKIGLTKEDRNFCFAIESNLCSFIWIFSLMI
jgi:hypothetical protein